MTHRRPTYILYWTVLNCFFSCTHSRSHSDLKQESSSFKFKNKIKNLKRKKWLYKINRYCRRNTTWLLSRRDLLYSTVFGLACVFLTFIVCLLTSSLQYLPTRTRTRTLPACISYSTALHYCTLHLYIALPTCVALCCVALCCKLSRVKSSLKSKKSSLKSKVKSSFSKKKKKKKKKLSQIKSSQVKS